MISYRNLLLDSWLRFKKNKELVLPAIIRILFIMGFLIIIGIEILLFWAFSKGNFNFDTIFTLRNLPILIIFGILDIVILFLIGSYTSAMEIGMLMDIATKGKTSIKNMFLYGKKFMFRYLKTILLVFLMILPILAVLISVMVLLKVTPAITALLVMLFVLFIIFLIIMGLFLNFIEPMIVTKEGAINIIKTSFGYSRKNMKHTLIVFGMRILIAIVIGAVISTAETLVNLTKNSVSVWTGLYLIFILLQWAANIVVNLVTRLFVFKSYLAKK